CCISFRGSISRCLQFAPSGDRRRREEPAPTTSYCWQVLRRGQYPEGLIIFYASLPQSRGKLLQVECRGRSVFFYEAWCAIPKRVGCPLASQPHRTPEQAARYR